jgi:integrase
LPYKTDHLQLHGSQYRVRIAVPEALRPQFGGKAFLIASLGTGNLSEADRRKGEHVSRFKRMIAQARETGDPVLKEARMFRRWEEERRAVSPNGPADDAAADTELAEISELVAEEHGDDAAQTFYEVASGLSTPLAEYLDEWIADRGYIGSSASHHRNAFAVLAAWCKSSRIKPTLETIDSRTAWSFRDKCLRVRSSEPKTVNNFIWSYRSHWRWLQRRGRVEINPWLGLNDDGRSQRIREQGARKRPFTDSEVRALLSGSATPLLRDLMMVAALTGARINVICELRVRDCKGEAFTFKPAKQEPAARRVPIHPELNEIVARRLVGKAPEEFLFDECPNATMKRPRSAAPSQAFTRYRRDMEVDERADWKRQSNVDFHSFRRWFTTKAEQAGQLPHIIDAVTGHKRPGETLGRYSQGPSMEQLRACVEAVNLPRLPAHVRKVLARRPHSLAGRKRTVRARKRSA